MSSTRSSSIKRGKTVNNSSKSPRPMSPKTDTALTSGCTSEVEDIIDQPEDKNIVKKEKEAIVIHIEYQWVLLVFAYYRYELYGERARCWYDCESFTSSVRTYIQCPKTRQTYWKYGSPFRFDLTWKSFLMNNFQNCHNFDFPRFQIVTISILIAFEWLNLLQSGQNQLRKVFCAWFLKRIV